MGVDTVNSVRFCKCRHAGGSQSGCHLDGAISIFVVGQFTNRHATEGKWFQQSETTSVHGFLVPNYRLNLSPKFFYFRSFFRVQKMKAPSRRRLLSRGRNGVLFAISPLSFVLSLIVIIFFNCPRSIATWKPYHSHPFPLSFCCQLVCNETVKMS